MKKTTYLIISFLLITPLLRGQNTCETAVEANVGSATTVGTINGTAPTLICDSALNEDVANNGAWYTYTATVTGSANIFTNHDAPPYLDTNMFVYTGSCGDLECLANNDDRTFTDFRSEVNIPITQGTTYFIVFDNRWSAAGFNFLITESEVDCGEPISLPYSENFNDIETIVSCWDFVDNDGDNINWHLESDNSSSDNYVVSESQKIGLALTPDNWLISPAIDLTPYNSNDTVELSWEIRAPDVDSPNDNYSVYISTGNTVNDFLNGTLLFNEEPGANGAGGSTLVQRSVDITSEAGQIIYFAFRHHDTPESQLEIHLDNVAIDFTLTNSEYSMENLAHFYQPQQEILTIKSPNHNFKNLKLYNHLGQLVFYQSHQNAMKEIYNLSQIANATYIAKVQFDDGNSLTFQFPKY
ncbi:T9SS-dependent choice-of-anchor J family protein [Aegicerativicinus sediminis]|uniref:T9SS-dependent choice-of-anchor J family protein n=1 Tax=Aegicerativicinus sediminis TaxID=2893202 RepID=UPI001E354ED4|nr:choice-of-anchor J domain-containing protein [Aegicerativicinus sediminis]